VLLENTVATPARLGGGACTPRTFINEKFCRVLPSSEVEDGCFLACGSVGEVANSPSEGHQLPYHMVDPQDENPYKHFDNRYKKGLSTSMSKSVVWIEKALGSDDQLRQRMAWALSQIVVVAVPGVGKSSYAEAWTSLYDIFVRNAFGNYRDILREITHNPIMGEYLTYKNSKSFDASQSYPDENYAREIMQLFTIGLFKLHPNGTCIVDELGQQVSTYDNEHIMSFARVFTGFSQPFERSNVEWLGNEFIDPMRMTGKNHDPNPKRDLDGGFLGDGFPLCSDLPAQAFLSRDARYEFLGYTSEGPSLALQNSSALFAALCGAETEEDCTFKAVVSLAEALACSGAECALRSVSVVRVGAAFYEFVPPACTHLFFYNGRAIAKESKFNSQTCVDETLQVAGTSCCAGCTDKPTSWMLTNRGWTCQNASRTWMNKKCKQESWRARYCHLTCYNTRSEWNTEEPYPGVNCSAGVYRESRKCDHIGESVSFAAAGTQCTELGMGVCAADTIDAGCASEMHVWTPTACSPAMLRVHADGKVSGHTQHPEPNRFAVSWTDSAWPAPGDYDAHVELQAVFSSVPNQTDVLSKLRLGAFAQSGNCTHGCGGDVRAFAPSGVIDAATVFECCGGRFFKNAESVVYLNSSHSFRNPPVFIRPGPLVQTDAARERAALAEVESLLDHLFHHPNTPPFVSKRLIQRFVSSNPSPAYVEAVAEAFSTGQYNETVYSGRYGDLAATLVAILMHPEARTGEAPTTGLHREPILKLIHFMRAMEYTDSQAQAVVMSKLSEDIGQFPYEAPSVFNYFDADFMPPRLMEEPEPEPEAEPEPLAAPEFEIFTTPYAMNFLNGLSSLIEYGVSPCADGFGVWDGRNGGQTGCYKGALSFAEAESVDATLQELDLLLTGGRLTPVDAAAVRAAYEGASTGAGLKAAQHVIALTPEFHNAGVPKPNGTRPASEPPASVNMSKGEYKATVMLYLGGGADTYHMLVPIECNLYDEYKARRVGVAHNQSQLLPITAATQPQCQKFGLHPALSFVADLYENQKQAAFVSNIGSLVEPITREQLQSGSSRTCTGLYSHSHQTTAAHTLQCQTAGAAPRGAGGRVADQLAASGYATTSFSLAGSAVWSQGFNTSREIVDPKKGAIRFNQYNVWADSIANITSQKHGNIYCEEYNQAFAEAIESSEELGTVLDDVSLETDYQADSALSRQLHQVARLIKSREARGAERDIFYISLGGFDTHADLESVVATKFKEIDDSLAGFVAELKAQDIFDSVVLATESDFGRTLTWNGQGTDHGWGGNHLVIGGGIKGGQIFNEFLETFAENSQYDAGRGRVIPKYPWESMMVPIAEWMGLERPDVTFPNLGNFNQSEHIIDRHDLFN